MLRSAHPLIPRVERHHALIEELSVRAPRGSTAEQLAGRLGVSTRTVERDIADLRETGVPVGHRRGNTRGYFINARRDLPPLLLSPGEAAALVASVAAIGPQASATAQSAFAKLLDALTQPEREERT